MIKYGIIFTLFVLLFSSPESFSYDEFQDEPNMKVLEASTENISIEEENVYVEEEDLEFVVSMNEELEAGSVEEDFDERHEEIAIKILGYFDKVPTSYAEISDNIEIMLPENNLITYKNMIKVKGVNRYMTAVFVNGVEQEIRNDGRFYFDLPLEIEGKSDIVFTFTMPDFSVINLKRKVYKLFVPKDLKTYKNNRELYTYFFNTDFLNNPSQNRTLGDSFTRADLAYFIAKINKQKISTLNAGVFEDVSSDYWASSAIKYSVDKQYMNEFPDGKFYPEKPIQKIEYIISLVKACQYPLNLSIKPLKYEDTELPTWTSKYVVTAKNNGLLPESKKLEPNKSLKIADVIYLLKDASFVKDKFESLRNFEDVELADSRKETIEAKVMQFLENRKILLASQRKIEFKNPIDGQIVLMPYTTFIGKIFPPEKFNVNGKEILPNIEGVFRFEETLSEGLNEFEIKALGVQSSISMYYLTPYEDLKGHWLEEKAAILKHLNVLENKPNFEPNKTINRAELAKMLVAIFDMNVIDNTEGLAVNDVTNETPYYKEIASIIDYGILKGDTEGNFKPNDLVTRVEAITAIVRVCEYAPASDDVVSETVLPFVDVSKSHWVRKYLIAAIDNYLISPAKTFRPNEDVTRAELIAMLFNTLHLQQKVQRVFKTKE